MELRLDMAMLNVFISHPWDRNDLYNELGAILGSAFGAGWCDRSIGRDNAVSIATGEMEVPQRRELLAQRLDAIVARTEEIDATAVWHRARLTDAGHEQEELAACRTIDKLLAAERDRILDPGYDERVRRLERLQRKYGGVDVDAALRAGIERIQEMESTLAQLRAEMERLVREARACRSSFERLDVVTLGTTGKSRDRVLERFPNLALAIRNRIAGSDVVMVVVTPHSAFREWLEFEYQEAFVLRRSTICLLHPGLAVTVPPDLRGYGFECVPWDPAQILDAVRSVIARKERSV